MNHLNIDRKILIREALSARCMSYCKYSNFAVGAALLCNSGKIYKGCNIENAAYSPSNCAERTAFFKAISEGEREFVAIAIVGGIKNEPINGFAYPCGVCRQVMAEFCDLDKFLVIVAQNADNYIEYNLKNILPYAFDKSNLDLGE